MIYYQCADTFFMLMMQKYTMQSLVTRENLQRVVDEVKEWCDQWLLSLNVNKCRYFVLYEQRNLHVISKRWTILRIWVCFLIYS